MRLFSNRSQGTSKRGKNISDTLGCVSCATFLFLPHLTSSVIYYWTDARITEHLTSSVIYYWTDAQQHGIYLLNRCMVIWNIFIYSVHSMPKAVSCKPVIKIQTYSQFFFLCQCNQINILYQLTLNTMVKDSLPSSQPLVKYFLFYGNFQLVAKQEEIFSSFQHLNKFNSVIT